MKLYKITSYIVDFDDLKKDGLKILLENLRNFHLFKIKIQEADIGEWTDEHILNYNDTSIEEFEKYFK